MPKNDMDDIYNDIIRSATKFAAGGSSFFSEEDDDFEELMTSKEIAEEQKKTGRTDVGLKPGAPAVEIDEEIHFKRYTTRRQHKYTEKEMADIRAGCEATIVHDYGPSDIFHMSDEDRRETDMLAEIRLSLSTLKRTYRRVDQYIEAMRIVVKAWSILERNNYIHTRDEFYKLVAKGKIVSSSIIMPKLKGIGNYNMDMIIKYISNPDVDASTLQPKTPEVRDRWYDRFAYDFYDNPEYLEIEAEIKEQWEAEGKTFTDEELSKAALDEMELRKMHRLLSDEELQYIHDHADNPPEMYVHNVPKKFIKGYDLREGERKRKLKKLKKKDRKIAEATQFMLNHIQTYVSRTSGTSYNRGFLMANGLFNTGEKEKNIWDDELRFQGSWANKSDVFINTIAAGERLRQERAGAADGYSTYADRELQQFFEQAESAGINTLELRRRMNCTEDQERVKSNKRERKANRKIEAALVKRITDMNRDPKFKKIIAKAEKEVNEHYGDY